MSAAGSSVGLHGERSAGGSPVHLSARLQSVYDEFFNDAKQKRVMALAEKERRMAEMTMLMHNPPTAAQLKNMSTEEQAALKAAVEDEMKGGHADAKALNEELQARRQALKDEANRKKREEQARIKAENEAMRQRIQNTGAATDNDTSDDATGAARRKMAAESAARRAASQRELARQNKEMKTRIKNTKAATDDDVTDDVRTLADGTVVKGGGRAAAAKAAKQRKAAEAERLAAENAAFRDMIANTGAATDNDITDDATGAERRKAAKASKQRKAAEAAQLAADNAAKAERIRNTGAATDNDVTDDVTVMADGSVVHGGGRDAAAAASKARKEADRARLAAENEQHRQNLTDIKEAGVETGTSQGLW